MMRRAIPTGVISFDMGTRNLSYCQLVGLQIQRWGMVDLGKHQARTATDNLVKVLEGEHRWMRESGLDVVVELQPTNGPCKTLSHCLQTYFALADLDDHRACSRGFMFMQAGNKSKFDSNLYKTMSHASKADRKKIAMATALRILAVPGNERWLDFYKDHLYKQRTDLADSLVQGCRYTQIHNLGVCEIYEQAQAKQQSENSIIGQQLLVDQEETEKYSSAKDKRSGWHVPRKPSQAETNAAMMDLDFHSD